MSEVLRRKKMRAVNNALFRFKMDLKLDIMEAVDADKSQGLLKKSGILEKAKAIAEADKNLSWVEQKIKKGVDKHLVKYVRDQIEDTGFDTTKVVKTASSIQSAIDTVKNLKELTEAKTGEGAMQVGMKLALGHVGGKVPALGPMMKFYSNAIDSVFDGIDTINWREAEKNLGYWELMCDDRGEGQLLSYRWGKAYVAGSLMTTSTKGLERRLTEWLASW